MILSYPKVSPVSDILLNSLFESLISLSDSLCKIKLLSHLDIIHFKLLVKLQVPDIVQDHFLPSFA
jgi:hypothetical protein